jgi:hypothetical protein
MELKLITETYASMGHIHDVEPNHKMGLDWDIELDRMVTTTFQRFD